MGVRLRSLSEDFTDACSHTWSVAFFLILALILLLTPPPPPSSPSPTSNKKNSNPDHHQPQKPQPEYDVTCWLPAQFEQSQVDYSNRICSLRFDAWLHGKPQPMIPSADSYTDSDVLDYSKNETDENNKNNKNKNNDVDGNSNDNDKPDGQSSSEEMSSIKTPVLLFILAIALRIPGMLWSVMSRYCNGFNVGRTLESAEKGDVMSLDGRRQFYASLFQAIQKHTRRSGKTVTGLYLFMKAGMILVLVAEILVVTVHVLPQLRHDDPGVVATAGHGKTDSDSVAKLTTSSSSSSSLLPPPSSSSSSSSKPGIQDIGLSQTDRMEFLKGSKDTTIFHCFFQIRNMQAVRDYTVQCIVQQQKQQQQQQQHQHQDERQALFLPLLQSNVFLIALVSLVFLLILNVVSALSWLAVLANQSTRTGLGLRPDSPLDLVFLLQMARDNLSVGVATGLVDSVRDEESTKGCEEEGGLVQKVL